MSTEPVMLSPKAFRLVRPSLSLMNPHWMFSVTVLMCSEITSQRTCSVTLLGPKAMLSGLLRSGSSLLSLKIVFSQSFGTSHNSYDLLKIIESSFAIKLANSDAACLGLWTCLCTSSFSGS